MKIHEPYNDNQMNTCWLVEKRAFPHEIRHHNIYWAKFKEDAVEAVLQQCPKEYRSRLSIRDFSVREETCTHDMWNITVVLPRSAQSR